MNVSQEGHQVTALHPESILTVHPLAQKETNLSEITNGIDTQHLKQVMMKRKYDDHDPNLRQVSDPEGMGSGMCIIHFPDF